MALQVWLPLNGNIRNQGLLNITPTLMGSGITYVNGKIGKAAQFPNNCNSCIHMPGLKMQTGSWATWIKVLGQGATNSQRIISEGRDSYSDGVEFILDKAGTTLSFKAHTKSISTSISLNTWYHICGTFGDGIVKFYVNGIEVGSDTYTDDMDYAQSSHRLVIGKMSYSYTNTGNYFPYNGIVNDVRIYDHVLSIKEIKELNKCLILHYKLDGGQWQGENLFRGTSMDNRTSFPNNASTDFQIPFRFYNGNASMHNFTAADDGGLQDTVTLSAAGNIGICFGRLVEEIPEWDPTSYYTISCWAKTTKASAHLDIGISYYNTSNAWVWRGGSNAKNFSATNTWQFFTHTFKPDANTKAIDYCFTVLGVANGTDTFTIKHCKLEKGKEATPWLTSPADPDDVVKAISNIQWDSSGYGYNGTVINANTSVNTMYSISDSPKYGSSSYFNGGNSGILIENLPLKDVFNTEVTISFWLKPNGENGQRSIYFGSYNTGPSWSIEKTTANKLRSYWNGNPDETASNVTITDGIWQHIVITKKGTNDIKIYLNGELKQNFTTTHNNLDFITTYRLGRDTRYNDNTPYKGLISDFRIYSTALSIDDILELYHTGASVDKDANLFTGEVVE